MAAFLAVAVALLLWPIGVPPELRTGRRVRGPGPESSRLRRAVVAAAAVAGAILLVWPSAWAPAVFVSGVAALAVWLSGAAPPAADVRRSRSQLAMICELWAAGLDCGLAVGGALLAALQAAGSVGAAADSSVGRLHSVASLLQLGADTDRGWRPADPDPQLAPIAAAARRTSVVGTDLATAIRSQAQVIRRAEFGAAQRRAARAGVLMTAPLTLCFLPAFICLGLAPVVIALLDTLNIGH